MNITVKTVHICRFTDRYYLWNDRFSVLSWKFCPFKGFLDLVGGSIRPWVVSALGRFGLSLYQNVDCLGQADKQIDR